jgi:hypothetical protein
MDTTGTRTVVLVEGVSDQVAVGALAELRGRDLAAEGVEVVAMGGATNIRHAVARYGPAGLGLRLACLCDAGEEAHFRRGLEGVDALGCFVCDADLEDELIRALGVAAVERIIAEQGELASLRTLRKQEFHRGRRAEQQLHRFIGVRSGRKARYARLLVEALDAGQVPGPLDALLASLSAARGA